MYGYVLPKLEQIQPTEYTVYRAFFCGMCLDISKRFGQLPRFATNYDTTFFAILLNDYLTAGASLDTSACISSMGKRRVIVTQNELMMTINDLNIMLAYHKILDDISDSKSLKSRLAKSVLNRAFKRASNRSPQLLEIIQSRLDALKRIESDNSVGLDYVSDSFASLYADLAGCICGDKMSDIFYSLCYNVGKYIYLIDALDDIDKDAKEKSFNVWLSTYGEQPTRQQFFEANRQEIDFCINSVINRVIACFNDLVFTQCYSLLKNIIHHGLRNVFAIVTDSPQSLGRRYAERYMRQYAKKRREEYKQQSKKGKDPNDDNQHP